MPVAIAGRIVAASAFVALPAQEGVDFGLDGRLHHEPDSEAADLLQDGAELLAGDEQFVNLCADGLDGRYSSWHGCGSSFVSWKLLKEPTPVARLHQGCDATAVVPFFSEVIERSTRGTKPRFEKDRSRDLSMGANRE